MAPDPIVQERVYRALKADLRSGLFLPGDHAGIRDLSKRYGSSETPVREAAWRAVGEGLLDPDPSGGFRTPLISETILRDIYRWNALHTISALSLVNAVVLIEAAADAGQLVGDAFDPVRTTATLFNLIAGATTNSEFISATSRMNARLSAIRMAEQHVLDDNQQEISAMLHMLSAGSTRLLQKAIRRYHAVRDAEAPTLVDTALNLRRERPSPET